MSDSFGGAKRGKTANSSDIAALKRKLATAKTYTEQPLHRVFKSASDVMSLGIVNNTLQAQTYITTGAAFDIYNQLTGKIIYEGQLTGQPVDYQALLALLSAKLGIPASNLKVSVKAGSVIIEWSTTSPIITTYTSPDVRGIMTALQEALVTNPVTGIGLVNGGSATASITNTTNNTVVLSMPSGQLEYVLSATDTTITVNGIAPGTYTYIINPSTIGTLGISHVLSSLTPNTRYTVTIGNGRPQEIRTAPTITVAQSGRDVAISGLDNATYLYSLDSGVTWLLLASNRIIPNIVPGVYTIQVMLQNLAPTSGVGVVSRPITVTVLAPAVPTYTFQGQTATFTIATLPYLNAAGYVYTLIIQNTTNTSQSPAPSIVTNGSATVNGFILTDAYTAAVSVTSSDGTNTATSVPLSLILPPSQPAPATLLKVSPTSLNVVYPGMSSALQYSYSIDGGATWVGFSTSPHIVTGLLSGFTYSVLIQTSNISGMATSLASNSVTLDQQTPVITPTTSTSFTISNIGTDPLRSYSYSLNGGPWNPVSGSSYLVTGVSAPTQYSVQVRTYITADTIPSYSTSAVSNTIVLQPETPLTPTLRLNGITGTITNTEIVRPGYVYSYKLTAGGVAGAPVLFGSTTTANPTLAYNTEYTVTVTVASSYDSTLFATSLPSTAETTPPAVPRAPTVTSIGKTVTITNNDTQAGCTYEYTVLNGSTVFKTGTFTTQTVTIQNVALNTTYTVTVTATRVGSAISLSTSVTPSIPTPSTPTLSLISSSYTSLLVGNVDNYPGYTYSYTLNTGTTGLITSLASSGTGYIVSGLIPNTEYSIGITATIDSLNISSIYSSVVKTPPVSTPILSLSPGSITSFEITNLDNYAGYTYYYATLADQQTKIQISGNKYTFTVSPPLLGVSVVIHIKDSTNDSIYLSAFSNTVTLPISKPTIYWASNEYTSVTIGNIDNYVGYTYEYAINGPFYNGNNYSAVTGGTTQTVAGPTAPFVYSANIRVKYGSTVMGTVSSDDIGYPDVPDAPPPTLTLIPGSYTSLLLGNIPTTSGIKYYYRFNTDPALTYRAISTLTPSGSGYTLSGLIPGQQYSVAIIGAARSYGNISTYATLKIPMHVSIPTLSVTDNSWSLIIGNVDSYPVYTYSYTLNTGTTGLLSSLASSGTGYIVSGLIPNTEYSVSIQAKDSGGIVYSSAAYSAIVRTLAAFPEPNKPILSLNNTLTSLSLTGIDTNSYLTYYYSINNGPLIPVNPDPAQPKTSSVTVTGLTYNTTYTAFIQAQGPNLNAQNSQSAIPVLLLLSGTIIFDSITNPMPSVYTLPTNMNLTGVLVGSGGTYGSGSNGGNGAGIIIHYSTPLSLAQGLKLVCYIVDNSSTNYGGFTTYYPGDCVLGIAKNNEIPSLSILMVAGNGGNGVIPGAQFEGYGGVAKLFGKTEVSSDPNVGLLTSYVTYTSGYSGGSTNKNTSTITSGPGAGKGLGGTVTTNPNSTPMNNGYYQIILTPWLGDSSLINYPWLAGNYTYPLSLDRG